MADISIKTETAAHINDSAPKIRVHNSDQDKYLPDRSTLVVTYEGERASDPCVKLFLDYESAKALAEGILQRLEEMKYREVKDSCEP